MRHFTEARSDLSELSKIRAFVRQVGGEHARPPLEEERMDLLELAVSEAASNIVVHAYGGEPQHWIRLTGEVNPDSIAISLIHNGKPFDPTLVPAPSFDGSRASGFGVYLIKNCVENLTYDCDDRGINRVSGRGDIPFDRQVELDVEYINSQSLWLDVKLLLKTIPAVLTGREAD